MKALFRFVASVVGFLVAIVVAGGAGGLAAMYFVERYHPPVALQEKAQSMPAPPQLPAGPAKPCVSHENAGDIFRFAAGLSGELDRQTPAELTSSNSCYGVEDVIHITCQQVKGGFGGEELCSKL